MAHALRYPIGIQTFEKLVLGGYVYVDKTGIILELAARNGFFFLSRPRKFGKSLLLSTFESLFKGDRHLFKGLEIDSLPWEWERHEVLHLDFNGENYKVPDALENFIDFQFREYERKFSVKEIAPSLGLRFRKIIEAAKKASGKNIVILIDEYDKPMLDVMHDEELLNHNRSQLQALYSVLKTMYPFIKFALLTGVTIEK